MNPTDPNNTNPVAVDPNVALNATPTAFNAVAAPVTEVADPMQAPVAQPAVDPMAPPAPMVDPTMAVPTETKVEEPENGMPPVVPPAV